MLVGIWRERIFAATFFNCCKSQTDVFIAASRFPEMIFQLIVVGSLSAAFIPVFSHYLTKDEDEAYNIASSLINFLFIVFILLAGIIFIFSFPFSKSITGQNFNLGQLVLMSQMTRVMLFVQFFFLISSFFAAISQSKRRFLLPSLSPIIYNISVILCITFFSGMFGIWSAVLGMLIGSFLHLTIQIPLVFKLGFRLKFAFDFKHPGFKKILKLMFPRTLGLAADQVQATTAVFFATSLLSGSLTMYNLAQKLADLPVRLLGTSIGQAALPVLSSQLAEGKIDDFKNTIKKSLNQIFYLSLPATVLFLVLRVQLVRLAYGAKTFPWGATINTGKTLAAITFSIFSQCAIQLLVRGFYALHNTVTPFVIGLTSVLVNIVLSWIFIFILKTEIFGLALAYSISNLINFVFLFFFFNRKEKIVDRSVLLPWGKMLLISITAGIVSWISMRFMDENVFDTSKTIHLLFLTGISGFLGLGTYVLLSKIFKLEELRVFLSLLRKIGGWRKSLFSVTEIIEPH